MKKAQRLGGMLRDGIVNYFNATRIVLLAALLIAALSMLTVSSQSTGQQLIDKPFGLTFNIRNIYLFNKINDYLYIVAVSDTQSSASHVYLVQIEPSLPPSIKILANISIPSRACCLSVDSKEAPETIAVIYGSNILIYDLKDHSQIQFSLRGKPLKILPNGKKSFLALTDQALYNIRYDENKWFEERITVGTLLRDRIEGRKITDIIPVYGVNKEYTYMTIAKESTAYTATLQTLVLWDNGTRVLNGQLIASITNASISSPPAPVVNGIANIMLIPGVFNITFYLSIGGICYKGPTMKIALHQNMMVLPRPITFSNKSITICPQPVEAQHLVLIAPGYPPRELIMTNSSTEELGDIRLLASYIMNNHLYIWIAGAQSKVFTRDRFIALLVYDAKTLKPLTYLWQYYDGIDAKYVALSSDYRLAVIRSDNAIYISVLTGNSYYLTWSIPSANPLSTLSVIKLNENSYIVMTVSKEGFIELVYVKLGKKPPVFITLSQNNAPYVRIAHAQYGYLGEKDKTIYMAIASSKGLTVITNINTVIETRHIIKNMYNYIVGSTKITVYNEDGRLVENYIVLANLTYNNITLIKTITRSNNGTANIPCISYGTVSIQIKPLQSSLYKPLSTIINCSNTYISHDDIRLVLTYIRYNLTISIIDSYSKTAPLNSLNITLRDLQRNRTITTLYPAHAKQITISRLLPGAYSIRIVDQKNTLYYPKTVYTNISKNTNLSITIDRYPATVTIKLIPKPNPAAKGINIQDQLKITVLEPASGRQVFSSIIRAPLTKPTAVVFTTLYRGPASLVITDIPSKENGKFYEDVRKQIYISDKSRLTLYSIELKQLSHPVTIRVNTPDRKAVNYLLSIYVINVSEPISVVNTSAIEYTLFLPIGHYCFKIVPLNTYLGYRVYSNTTKCYTVKGLNDKVVLNIGKIRKITKITILDPLSKGGIIMDNITVILDGREAYTLPKGKPKNIYLPILVNGSHIEIVSKNNIYKKLDKIIKPMKIVIIRLIRPSFKYSLSVLSTQGQPISSAIVNINGIDNILKLRYTTDDKGMLNINIPYGKYQVCITKQGYISKCYTLNIRASASNVITLKPTILTLIRSYIVPIAIIVVGVVLVIVTRAYFKRVLERLSEEEF